MGYVLIAWQSDEPVIDISRAWHDACLFFLREIRLCQRDARVLRLPRFVR